jgi:hypothetical protein
MPWKDKEKKKAAQRRYLARQSEESKQRAKEAKRRYRNSVKGKATESAYASRPDRLMKYKVWSRTYRQTEHGKEKRTLRNKQDWKERKYVLSPRKRMQAHLKYEYGMTMEEWDVMLVKQQGRCAICEEPMESPRVDHCHETERLRGMLCHNCNAGLGHFKDSIDRLGNAVEYLSV